MTRTSSRHHQRDPALSVRAVAFRLATARISTAMWCLLAMLSLQEASAGPGLYWQGPTFALPLVKPDICRDYADAEQLYANAREYDHQDSVTCVDQYFEAAVLTARRECHDRRSERTRHVHDSSVQKLVLCGHQFGRLNLSRGLTVIRGGVKKVIPIHYRGFIWKTDQFDLLTPVGEYLTDELTTNYRCPGVGVPMIATSRRRTDGNYRSELSTFSATLRLNVDAPSGIQLELYDPLRVDTTRVGQTPCPIHKDLSAVYAYRLRVEPSEYFTGFINPNATNPNTGSDQGKLYTLEPYQRGKIPIVMIHGLLSDPFTWAEMVNELRVHPEFTDRFQIWLFEYPTGRPFLASAAELRAQIEGACRKFDPHGADPALSNLILMGHSMGGLVAKMQVTTSGNQVWDAAADRSFNQIVMCDDLRDRLARTFFFEPSPRVTRVIYLATPHRGSAFATRLIGRFASTLVREPKEIRQQHADLIRDNPGVFSKEVSRRVPTSIDLLEPKSKLLQAIDKLPVRHGVTIHSIIGNKCINVTLRRSDGVVPVANATDYRSMTERFVKATHGDVKKHPDAIEEVRSILALHLNQSNGSHISAIPSTADHESSQFQREWVTSAALH